MRTPILDGIRKQAGFGTMVSSGLSHLARRPQLGSAVLGGTVGAGIGAIAGGDLKSTVAGAGIGAGAGYGAARMGANPTNMFRKARVGWRNFRRPAAEAVAKAPAQKTVAVARKARAARSAQNYNYSHLDGMF